MARKPTWHRILNIAIAIIGLLGTMATYPTRACADHSIQVEIDKLDTAKSVPKMVTRSGGKHSLKSIYKQAKVKVTTLEDETIKDLKVGGAYSNAELHNLHIATANKKPTSGWHLHILMMTKSTTPDVIGIMFMPNREALAVFTKEIEDHFGNSPENVLRTTAHEIGHAFNLFHSDGDGDKRCCSGEDNAPTTGRSLMNQTRCLGDDWTFDFSQSERMHLLQHPVDRIRPGSNYYYGDCISEHAQAC